MEYIPEIFHERFGYDASRRDWVEYHLKDSDMNIFCVIPKMNDLYSTN